MLDNLKKHEKEIVGIVNDTVKETFRSYFNIDCDQLKTPQTTGKNTGITCKAEFKNANSEGAVFVTIEEAILDKISSIIYPPDSAKMKESYQACAIEIANIVGMRVRTYLNDNGYDLEMSIPSIASLQKENDDDIYISFSIEDRYLHIDIKFKVIELATA